MTLHLSALGPRPWHRVGRVHARGHAFTSAGEHVEGPALAAHLDGSAATFVDRAAALDGTFAAVHTGEATTAVVDRIRSLPLFYGRDRAGRWHLSDDAHRIAEITDARLDDATAAAEFMLQSNTTGATTLSSSVRQVQAGEAVTFGLAAPESTRYFRYADGAAHEGSEEELIDEGVQLFERTFDRLIASLRGRPVVVPLSGGMDSRLIAAMLVRGGRTDALCFSYGRERSFEARASRRVADALGLRWTFVPYANRDWHRWFSSDAFQQYRRGASGLTAIEHEQDWPAVRALRAHGLASGDAVFVPGHAGDFLGGSHLPAAPSDIERDPVRWLWQRYYTEWPTDALAPDLAADLQRRIAACLGDAPGPARAFLRFGWQERQAKMIANSVRVYDLHGFDWRLPFWSDAAVLDFWGRVPIPLLRRRRLYFRVLRRLMGADLFDLPSTLRRESAFAGKLRRLTDRDLKRYGIWLGPRPLRAALHTRVGDVARVAHPVVGPVVEQCVRPVARRPLPWATINGLLAVEQLRTLSRRTG
jgi:asparagine synthase (glutamine-hydrolysing)